MSGTLRLRGATSGYSELQAPAVAADQTFVLPTAGGTLLTTDSPVPKLTLELGSASQPSLTFEGDTDTGLYSSGTNTLNLVTGGSDRLVIDSSGNVGVGTASPAERLHVYHPTDNVNVLIESGDANVYLAFKDSATTSNSAVYLGAEGNDMKFATSGNERLRIDSSGNVGINNNDPDTKLDVTGALFLRPTSETLPSENGVGIRLRSDTNHLQISAIQYTPSVVYYDIDYLGLKHYWHVNGSEKMQLDGSGRLLVGASSSAYSLAKLQIAGTDATNYVTITNTTASDSNGARYSYIHFRGTQSGGESSTLARIGVAHDGTADDQKGYLRFFTNSGSDGEGGIERMRINSSGNIGIGESAPDTTLHIDSQGATTTLKITSDTESSIDFEDHGGSPRRYKIGTNISSNDGQLEFKDITANVERMRIDSSGRVRFRPYGLSLPSDGEMSAPIFVALQGNTDPTAAAGSAQTFMLRTMDCGSTGSAYTGYEIRNKDSGDLRFLNQDSGISNRASFYIYQDTDINDLEKTFQISYLAAVYATGVYDHSTSSGANVNVASGGQLRRSTSSIRFKTDVETLEDSYADALLNCRPVWYRSTAPSDNPAHSHWGFIAEEVAEIDPRLVQWSTETTAFEDAIDNDGNIIFEKDGVTPQKMRVKTIHDEPQPESVAYERFVPHLLNLIKRQKQTIESLENRIAALENN